jgi:hypothetical protein
MPDTQHAIQIAAKPEAVHPLVSTGQGFGAWWAADITMTPGEVALGFFKRATVYRLRLAADQPPALADWLCESGQEWSGTHIVFRLESRPPGTLLRFTHAGWQAGTDHFTSCNTTWATDVPAEGGGGGEVARAAQAAAGQCR